MISFNNILNKDNLLKKVNNYQILKYYTTGLDVGGVISSPLRDDSTPSFSMFNYNGDALCRDFSTGKIYDGVRFVMEYRMVSFFDAISIINRDMGLGMYDTNAGSVLHQARTVSTITKDKPRGMRAKVIKISYRDWNQNDIDFWSRYGITIEQLESSRTFPIKYYWIGDSSTILADKLAYAYQFYEHENVFRVKIYQPYSAKFKWTTNLNNTVVDGIKELKYCSDTLIITSSRKDRLVLNNYKYESIAVNSESSFIPYEVFSKLNDRYRNILIMFDSDKPGIDSAAKISELYDIEYVHTPIESKTKDVSDYRSIYGDVKTKDMLYEIFLTKLIKNRQ